MGPELGGGCVFLIDTIANAMLLQQRKKRKERVYGVL
jgi:hypothetical protein